MGFGLLEEPLVRPLLVEQRLADAHQSVARGGADDARSLSLCERAANVHHGLRQRDVACFRGTMDDGDLIVILEGCVPVRLEPALAIRFEYRADALHAEPVQFGRAQRSHAGRAEHMDATGHRPQDFLVPDRWDVLENAVYDADRARPVPGRHAVDVALPHGGQTDRVARRASVLTRDRRTDEHVAGHGLAWSRAAARAPGT